MIEAENVSFSYQPGGDPVFTGVNLSVRAGEIASLIGPSGIGKSTLLKLLVGDLVSATGIARVNHEFAYLAQETVLLPYLTANENVILSSVLRRRPSCFHWDRVKPVFGLSDGDMRKFPHELSGGMRQKVSLLQMLSIPEVLLYVMDEPYKAIDRSSRIKISDYVWKDLKERRASMLFVTHDVEMAVAQSDVVLVLSEHGIRKLKVSEVLSSLLPSERVENELFANEMVKVLKSL